LEDVFDALDVKRKGASGSRSMSKPYVTDEDFEQLATVGY